MCGEGKTLLQTLLTDKASSQRLCILSREVTLSVLSVDILYEISVKHVAFM